MSKLAPGERFEWLETWVDDKREPVGAGHAELARRCPRCSWLDSVAEPECFRCGHIFDEALGAPEHPLEGGDGISFTREPGRITTGAIKVDFDEPEAVFTAASGSPRLFELRRRVMERGQVPGFDRLLSLAEVNAEIFQHFDHQRDVAMRALRELGGTALLADETGLGKTIEAGIITKELVIRGLARTVLVIVPASLTLQWREELHDKLGIDCCIVKNFADWAQEPPIVLTTYATIRGKGVGRHLRERAWDLLICDEAHYLKNRSTKQYKAVNRISKKYVLLLSATPFHNKLIELKNLLDLLKPGLFGSTRAFNKQYVDSTDPRRPINVHHLKTILSEVMIRNRRSKVLVQLPPRRACIVHLELSEPERLFYDAVSRFISREVRHLLGAHKPAFGERPGKLAERRGAKVRGARSYSYVLALISLQRETCSSPAAVAKTLHRMSRDLEHPASVRAQLAELAAQADALGVSRKARAVFDVLESCEGKLVIFCEFLATIDDLLARLAAAGVPAIGFDGRLSALAKHAALEKFRQEGRVLVASRSGGEGLNIQFCQNMINYDLPWNPMAVEQRIGRLHRLGQEGEVSIFNLSVKDTVEARVLELLTHKIKLFSSVIGEIDLILGSANDDKGFEQLLRDSWVRGQLTGAEQQAFEELGESIEAKRKAFDELKHNDAVIDQMAS